MRNSRTTSSGRWLPFSAYLLPKVSKTVKKEHYNFKLDRLLGNQHNIGAMNFCSFSRIKTKSVVFAYSSPFTITAANQPGGHRCRKPLFAWFLCSWPGTKDFLFMYCNKAGAKFPVGENDQNPNDISRDLVSTEFQLA